MPPAGENGATVGFRDATGSLLETAAVRRAVATETH